jgi:cytochrome oxidase Cu insertion factor (SCO1/SenC/PrrC family)
VPTQQLQAPDFTLEHVLGNTVSLSQFRGRNVVVVFGSRNTTEQIKPGVLAIRGRFGGDQVAVLVVLDLRSVPRPARKILKGKLKKGYEDMTAQMAAQGVDGGVNMLADWSGDVVDGYGVSVDEQAVAVAIDAQGMVMGYGSGDQFGSQILALLSPQ